MTVHVDRARCVGSGTCTQIAPELFVLEDGTARVTDRAARDDEQTADDIEEAVESCPVQAIQRGPA